MVCHYAKRIGAAVNERCVLEYHSRNYKITKLQKRCQLKKNYLKLNTVGLIFRSTHTSNIMYLLEQKDGKNI